MSIPTESMTTAELVEQYDVVTTGRTVEDAPYMVVAPRQLADTNIATNSVDLRELGTTSPSPFTSWVRQEYNTKLLGIQGLKTYDQMRRSDGTVRGMLRLMKTPVLAARWYIEPATGPGGTVRPIDKKAAEFVDNCLMKYMSISWSQVLHEALLMCDFGYYMFEKVWEPRIVDGRPRLVWKKLAPRHPMDVKEWVFDANGGPKSVKLYAPANNVGPAFQSSMTSSGISPFADSSVNEDTIIPINKLLVFTFDKEAGNIEGISILRTVYKHWFYKEQLYKIDAIQKERHGIGIPCVKLPLGFSTEDRRLADEIGRNLRTNERAHIVLPPNWEILMLKLEGQPVDALKSIEHHDEQIKATILASGLDNEQIVDLFLKSVRSIGHNITQTFNDYAIPELFALNFPRGDPPKLCVRRIGEEGDQRTLSFAIRNFVGSNIITPDDPLEAAVRESLDLPMADPKTARETASPQTPGDPNAQPGADGEPAPAKKAAAKKVAPPSAPKAGPPRQKPTPPTGPPRKNAGTDRSGG